MAGFFKDLQRVGALKRGQLDGEPSDNRLSRLPDVGVSRDTVGAWLRGQRFPQRLEPLLAVLREVRAEAARRKLLDTPAEEGAGESVAELLAERRWLTAWEAERQRRTESDQKSAQRQRAHRALEDEERRARRAALVDRPRPVRSWTPKRLGVHPAIAGHPASPASTGGAEFVLPAYVPRPHDEQLHARLMAALASDESLLVVVRGESCTGKTRTALEALAFVPDDFELLFPTDVGSLLATLAADALGPRTVLWLNEAQHYLDGPTGEAVAAALLHRLDSGGPFLAFATLWPDRDKALTTAPSPGADDPHRQARTLLAQAHYVRLPSSFAAHMDAVRRAARQDASLAAALEAGGADITQALAAGPDLVAHYEHPSGSHGANGKALISAAMDACRLGVTSPLPLAFLRDAAPGYLTRCERAGADPDTWFTDALAYARTPIKQTTKPLRDIARPSGMGALPDRVSLADYLQQHGRRTRQHLRPPAAFWDAATEHLADPADLIRLADSAREELLYRHAACLYCAAADAGDTVGLTRLAWMREVAGDQKGAERLTRQAFDAGNADALKQLAVIRHNAGDLKGAEQLYRAAVGANAADNFTLYALAKLRAGAGDWKEAEQLARQAANAGRPDALSMVAFRRGRAGDWEDAERLALEAADSGDSNGLGLLARLREEAGEREEAERLYRAAGGMWSTIRIMSSGRGEKTEPLYHAAADRDNTEALARQAQIQESIGHRKEAERLAFQAADAGDETALGRLAYMRELLAGDREGAEQLARRAADAGHFEALILLAGVRDEAGDREGAERLARQAADAGEPDAWLILAEMRGSANDQEEAERLAVQAADTGPTDTPPHSKLGYSRYGLETDGTAAEPWEWPEPRGDVN